MIAKILDTIWQFFKGLIIAIVVLLSYIYLMDLNAIGTPAVITKESTVYQDLAGQYSADDSLSPLTVVEEINDENAQGLSKIRYYNDEIGYVESDSLTKINLNPSEDSTAIHLAKVEADIDLSQDNTKSATTETVCTLLAEINTLAEDHPLVGIYVEVAPHKNWSYFTNILEEMKIPYGYLISYNSFESFSSITDTLDLELNNMYAPLEYNILPLAFDFSEQYLSSYTIGRIQSYYSDDVVFCVSSSSDAKQDINYWTTTPKAINKYESPGFVSSSHFATNFTEASLKQTVVYTKVNVESLLYQELTDEYNSLIEQK